jgi:membrane-bound lytic murein transglycosylase D
MNMDSPPKVNLIAWTGMMRFSPLWFVIIALFIMGCAAFQPASNRSRPHHQEATENQSAIAYGDVDETESDSAIVDPNLALAQHHFTLAEEAIGDRDPERVAQELEQALTYLSALGPNGNPDQVNHLIWFSTHVLESYRDFLVDMDVLPDEFVPEGVLLGNEEFPDSVVGWSEWSDIGLDTSEAALSDSETIMIFPPVPLTTNRKVNQVLNYYQGRGRRIFLRWMERGQLVLPQIQNILREEGLPEELAFLAMVESGLNPKAYSWAHASGPWQFIRSTGRLYGLYSDWWYDERRDIEKSTRAAAAYLKKLYVEFGDWYLAMAAYNCGELRVHRAIQRHHSRDFWRLWRLPRQTENYVPSFVAAALIMKEPTQYGFPEFQPAEAPATEVVWVSDCVDYQVLASCAATDVSTLKTLNPSILRWCTPPTVDSVALLLPEGTVDTFWEKYSQIPKDQKTHWIRHRVRSGETLSEIATRYGTTIGAIMDVPDNRLRNKHRIRVGQYLLIPAPPGGVTTSTWASSSTGDTDDPYEGMLHLTYRVKKGDYLGRIADQYRVSVSSLRRWNNLYGKRFIYPGQVLDIWVPDDGSGTLATRTNEDGQINHTVRRGESLWLIARRYGVNVSDIQGANGMGRRTTIKPGQVLIIPSRRSGG